MRFGPALAIVASLCVACTPPEAGEAPARLLGSYTWTMDRPWFGGFSGLELSDDGDAMTVLGDRSTLLKARILRDGDRVTGIVPGRAQHLKSSTGKPLAGRIGDSEGLAVAPDGTLFVSFEGVHRVARYDRADGRAAVLTRPALFRGMRANKSLEALAIDGKGRLYTLPEGGRDAAGQIPVFRRDAAGWTVAFTLPPRGGFKPVGADFGPDGRLYLLERDFSLFGFRSRLRRWRITDAGPDQEQTLLQTATGSHDNLEGVSIWRDAQGRLRATMISDDNFLSLQRTELVEYVLPD